MAQSSPRVRRSHFPRLLEWFVFCTVGLLYRVGWSGRHHLPGKGGVLLIANHLSYIDVVVLQVACPRPIRYVGHSDLRTSAFFEWVFRIAGVIAISRERPNDGMRAAIRALAAGEVVCVFPEGRISRTGQLLDMRKGFEIMARRAKVPVVPAFIDGVWGSIFSYSSDCCLWKSPRLMPTPVFVAFGAAIPHDRIDGPTARQALLDLGAEAFEQRPLLGRNLAREVVRALARHPGHVQIVDRTAVRRPVTAGQLLAAAAALSRRIRGTIPGRRVGIVLPPGAGAAIANIAVICAGKVPVNLNFTAGRAALEASLRMGGIQTVITADAMRPKAPDFPWPADTRDFRAELAAAGGKRAILPWLLAAWVLPNQWIPGLLGIPATGDREEAALLFTSGSSGEPKGVVLTHRNILANCAQVSSLSILPDDAVLMGCLPIFHSFGFTVTLWYPILRGCRVVTVPSPLDTRRIVEAIQQEQATVMLGAPTFIRPFLRKAKPAELRSLDLVVTGAEKLPPDLYERFREKFHIEILQGYGLTETTPAANLNQPNPHLVEGDLQEGKRDGSVGRLLPGMTARIVDPETGKELPATETGLLLLRGANVFPGYLDDPVRTAAAKRGDWFVTGDLARFDPDGFLFIEGRQSRFSKIGGEMVPHGTVEQRIGELFGCLESDVPLIAIAGVPDPEKGEALVLLAAIPITTEELRRRMLDAGIPALWIPRTIRRLEKIPVLGTGKLDLRACREAAERAPE